MKVLTFSTKFPKGHPRHTEPTHFVEKIWNGFHRDDFSLPESFAQWVKNFPFKGDEYLKAIKSIPVQGAKYHTIRAGNRFNVGDMISLRVWSAAPYRSKQIEFAQVEVKKVWPVEISVQQTSPVIMINGKLLTYDAGRVLAQNDGLTLIDFISWFYIHPKKMNNGFAGQIISWSDAIEYGKLELVTEPIEQELADKFKALISERTELDFRRGCGVSLDKNEYIGDRLADIEKELTKLKTPPNEH